MPWDSSSKWKPFCCERCRLIDLGEWLDEEKRIPEHQGPGNDFQEDPRLASTAASMLEARVPNPISHTEHDIKKILY